MTVQWDDRLDLEMLHLREAEGLSMRQIGARLGIGKNAVIGRMKRLRDAEAPGAAGDGTMGPRWWRKGLGARASASPAGGSGSQGEPREPARVREARR